MIRMGLVFVIGLLIAAVSSGAAEPAKEKAALSAAQAWMALVDVGKYAESWREAALFFRNAVTPEQWDQAVRGVRRPLGKLVSRKVKSTTYLTALPGAPDGEYVVITFATEFEHKKAAIETVTPMLETNGAWRVSGYFIR